MPKICFRDAKEWELLIEEMQMYIHVLSQAQVSYLFETEDCNFTTNRKVFIVTLLLIHLLLSQRKQKEKMFFISIAHILTPACLTEVGDSEEKFSCFLSS